MRVATLLEVWYVALGTRPIIVCSNDNPRLTLTYFTARSNLVPDAFIWGKLLKSQSDKRFMLK